jgi:hypothetical protein
VKKIKSVNWQNQSTYLLFIKLWEMTIKWIADNRYFIEYSKNKKNRKRTLESEDMIIWISTISIKLVVWTKWMHKNWKNIPFSKDIKENLDRNSEKRIKKNILGKVCKKKQQKQGQSIFWNEVVKEKAMNVHHQAVLKEKNQERVLHLTLLIYKHTKTTSSKPKIFYRNLSSQLHLLKLLSIHCQYWDISSKIIPSENSYQRYQFHHLLQMV